jgi:hypothetical protein
LPFVVLALCWALFALLINQVHYLAGALLAFILAPVVAGTISGVIQRLWIESAGNLLPIVSYTTAISLCLSCLFALVTAGAWMSYALYKLGVATLASSSLEPAYGNLVKTYLWHVLDIIPFTKPESTLGMKSPDVQFQGWVGGLPVLVFRVLVVIVVLEAIRDSWRIFTSSSQRALLARLKAPDQSGAGRP